MTAGVIFTGFGTKDYVHQSLAPWIELRKDHRELGCGDPIIICAVSVRFAGFEGEDDGTREILREYLKNGEIDYLIDGPDNIPETTARSMALSFLHGQNCDISIMWDSDEVVEEIQLVQALRYIEQDIFTVAWRFSYRNLVFTPDQWLADPFTPMRAHRLKPGTYVADKFYDDNNILYRGTLTRDFKQDIYFPTMTIPPSVMNPKHYTWLSDERSRKKVAYQKKRGWTCSFDWDDSKGGLIFNPALPKPKIYESKY